MATCPRTVVVTYVSISLATVQVAESFYSDHLRQKTIKYPLGVGKREIANFVAGDTMGSIRTRIKKALQEEMPSIFPLCPAFMVRELVRNLAVRHEPWPYV